MSINLNRPLLEFESSNYPDGQQKRMRITVGGAWISLVSAIVAVILNVFGKLSLFAWILKLIKQ